MSDYYDKDGSPLTLLEWAKKFESKAHKRVALDKVGPHNISTVWLGLDHSFTGPPPLIFETMVFSSDQSENDRQERYSTLALAVAGHKAIVAELAENEAHKADHAEP